MLLVLQRVHTTSDNVCLSETQIRKNLHEKRLSSSIRLKITAFAVMLRPIAAIVREKQLPLSRQVHPKEVLILPLLFLLE